MKSFPKKLVTAILSLRNWKAKACDRNDILSAKFDAICNDIVYLHVDSPRISGEPLNFKNGEYVAPGSFKIPLMDVKGETVRVNTEALKKVLACIDSEYIQIFAKSDGLLWIHGTAYDTVMVAAAICPLIDPEDYI